MTASWTQN